MTHQQNSRRRFFAQFGCVGVSALVANKRAMGFESPFLPIKQFELEERSITDLHAGLLAHKYTARMLVREYLNRIETLDRRGPALHLVIETNPEAYEIAEMLDAG